MTPKTSTKSKIKNTNGISALTEAKLEIPEYRSPTHVVGPVKTGGFLYFHPQDLLSFEKAQMEIELLMLKANLKRFEADKLKRDAEDRIQKLNTEILQLISETKSKEEKLIKLRQNISEKYEIDMTKISYDDETGKINFL